VAPIGSLEAVDTGEQRISSGIDGLDRVLGGGLVPASVMLLAGEPGIGKSTLLLQMLANLTERGRECLLASGEESREQVAARAARLGLNGREISFAPGRELDLVLATARAARPFLLAVDSIQTLRDTAGSQAPGGVAQVRRCADALVGLAKNEGIAVLMTGHVTKDGELAGPRALEHAVDVVCTFDGDSRSGLRVLAAGKNRFGAEGEAAWFEIGPQGLHEINPSELLISGDELPGSAIALPLAGRRAIAVEVQALFGTDDGSARRYVSGLEARRFQLVAAVLERLGGLPLGKADLYGATAGGLRVDDPGGAGQRKDGSPASGPRRVRRRDLAHGEGAARSGNDPAADRREGRRMRSDLRSHERIGARPRHPRGPRERGSVMGFLSADEQGRSSFDLGHLTAPVSAFQPPDLRFRLRRKVPR
jgi:DNA repair protein RadA/Sms